MSLPGTAQATEFHLLELGRCSGWPAGSDRGPTPTRPDFILVEVVGAVKGIRNHNEELSFIGRDLGRE